MMKYIVASLLCSTLEVAGFSSLGKTAVRKLETRIHASKDDSLEFEEAHRRQFLQTTTISIMSLLGASSACPQEAQARYVLDDDTGEYVEVQEEDWQTAWKQRLDKAQSMSQQEIFQAARGAGNLDLKDGPESEASKKRRAMSACRDVGVREKAKAGNERECTARVFGGEVDFLLEAL